MIPVLILFSVSVWCFAVALRLHRENLVRPRPEPDLRPGRQQAPSLPSAGTAPAAHDPRPDAREEDERQEDDTEEVVLVAGAVAPQPPETVAILRREIGGGETLVAVARWDGTRVRLEAVDLSPERLVEIQRLVLQDTGLWPGHGRPYLEALVAALDDAEGSSRWGARWMQAGAA
jgi:hypothetical protein